MPSAHDAKIFRVLAPRLRSCRGMSLVELMAVVAILGLVMGAVYSLMLPVQKSTYTQTRVVDMQDSLRLALDQMSLDVRHAGLLVSGEPIVNVNVNPPRQEFTVRLASRSQALGAQLTYDGTDFRITPPILLTRFVPGPILVKIVDAVSRDIVVTAKQMTINPGGVADTNANDPNRFDDDTVTFAGLTVDELNILTSEKILYVMPMIAGDPVVHTITYIFDPLDNTLPGVARPSLRRFEDWPLAAADGTVPAIPAALPNPLPQNWLLLGGDPPVAGAAKTYAAQFTYNEDADQVTIDITGATQAYDPNRPTDSLGNTKARRLQTTVALRNAIPTY